MNKKWSKVDILILALQVLAPVVATASTVFIPIFVELSVDAKLAIMGAGIVIPVILLQVSLLTGHNKIEHDVLRLESLTSNMLDRLSHISPILEQVFLTGNDRAKRFVYRRMDEVVKVIRTALSTNNSGNLRPSEYYEELLYLAELIIGDHAEQGKNFKGEIWAMTSFSDEEWIEDEGYEKLWTERLTEMVDKGIKTRRLCVVPDTIVSLISSLSFSETEANSVKTFKGFISFLEAYYGNRARKKIAEHYFARVNDAPELTNIKGFFAIKLTSGELHILHGETVNESGALTAKVLFDPSEIQRVRTLFELYSRPSQEFGKTISDIAKNNGFIAYLKRHSIYL